MKVLLFTLTVLLTSSCQYQKDDLGEVQESFTLKSSSEDLDQEKTIYRKFEKFSQRFPKVTNITSKDLPSLSKVVFVDVREKREYSVSMLESALTLEEFETEIEKYRDHTIIVYCTIGLRSGLYADEIMDEGFDAYNLLGGVLLWSHHQKEFFTAKGEKTNKVHVYEKSWDHLNSAYQSIY